MLHKVLLLEELEQELGEQIRIRLSPTDGGTDPLYSMLRYHMGCVDAGCVQHSMRAGKRLRPALLLLACEAVGGKWIRAMPAAVAVEFVHSSSLIHDDIEDGSETRRGRPTVWRIWGLPQALNA